VEDASDARNRLAQPTASVVRVPAGISSQPVSKYQHMRAILHRKWAFSLVRILAGQVYRLPLHMRAILRAPNLKFGPSLPLDPTNDSDSVLQHRGFLHACSDCIQQIGVAYQFGPLEKQALGIAFARGAEWHFHTLGKESCNEFHQP